MKSASNTRLAYIDALRGFACLWVMIHHALEHYPVQPGWTHWPLQAAVTIANLGWLGVSLFLVLSGFCLYFPLIEKTVPGQVRIDVRSFAMRRARRIYPPYFFSLVLSAALLVIANYYRGRPLMDGLTVVDIVRHLLLVHNWWPESFASINGVFWSLALEAQLYVIFPILVIFIGRRGFVPALFVLLVISLAWQEFAYLQHGLSLQWTSAIATSYHALPARAFEFLAGMTAAYLVAHPARHQTKMAIAVMSLIMVPAIYYAGWISRFAPLLDQLWGVAFAAMIVAVGRVPQRRFALPSALGVVAWVGGISFSIYLVHRPLFRILQGGNYGDAAVIGLTVAKIVAAIGVGYVFHLMFEKPFMKKRGSVNISVRPALGTTQ